MEQSYTTNTNLQSEINSYENKFKELCQKINDYETNEHLYQTKITTLTES